MRNLIDPLPTIDVSSWALPTAIDAAAAVFSGPPGFGFSAIGAFPLPMVPPQRGGPLPRVLSLASQAVTCGSLARELRRHAGTRHPRDGVMPHLAGGIVGLPIGLAILGSMASQPRLFSLEVLVSLGLTGVGLLAKVVLA